MLLLRVEEGGKHASAQSGRGRETRLQSEWKREGNTPSVRVEEGGKHASSQSGRRRETCLQSEWKREGNTPPVRDPVRDG